MNSLSLYIHIPFCTKKCRYCDFYSVPYDAALVGKYLATLSKEIDGAKNRSLPRGSVEVRTVFIGGGTPSVLSCEELRRLCGLVRSAFRLAPDCEWTVECNPESFTPQKAALLLDAGVTRLTFGFQSLDDRELGFLGRVHGAERCRELLADPMLNEFASIGIDLMYGLPGQTGAWPGRSLDPIFDSPCVKHISAYELTVADTTPLGRHRSMLPLPSEEAMRSMACRLWDILESRGFRQYEVSNFAQSGHECRHNRACWDHEPYLGLGCAAHSFVPPERFANVRDISAYCSMVNKGLFPREQCETLDAEKIAMEMIFLGLRRKKGIDLDDFQDKCGINFHKYANKKNIDDFIREGFLLYEKPFLKPTQKGLLMADAIAREIIP